jgi:hypothetical protein
LRIGEVGVGALATCIGAGDGEEGIICGNN